MGTPAVLLPGLATQHFFHTVIWSVVLTWLGVSGLSIADRRWRWLVCGVVSVSVLTLFPNSLLALGMVFQTPSLASLIACLAVAWQDLRGPSNRIFRSASEPRMGEGFWLLPMVLGWCLLLDAFGAMPWDLYSMGFDHRMLWFAWWGSGAWMAAGYVLSLPAWHTTVATCGLWVTGLFVLTHAPTGNVWDAWLDPGLWLYAHYRWLNARVRARAQARVF